MKTFAVLTALVLTPAASAAADLTGDWKVDSSVGTTPIVVNCTLVQKGKDLTGSCAPAGGQPTALTGSVEGSSAKWGYDVVFRDKPAHVGFTAEIKSDASMTGMLDLGGPKPNPFTATKK